MNNELHESLVGKKTMHANLIVVFLKDTKLGTKKTILYILNLELLLTGLH